MKKQFVFLMGICLLMSFNSIAQEAGSFTDARDGKVYKTVTIGKQTWMAENLAFKSPSGCKAYDNIETNVKTYGYLYDWETAKGVAPAGWHLPSDGDWKKLTGFLGGVFDGGEKIKASNTGGTGRSNGTNESGFNGLPAGRYALDKFEGIGVYWAWWTASKKGKYLVYDRTMKFDQYWVSEGVSLPENYYSVRYIKD